MSRKAHKKRRTGVSAGGSAFSKSLRNARDRIAEGRHEEALAALDQLAATTQGPKRRGRIARLIGESQAKLSRHAEAAVAFGRAVALGRQAQDMDLVLGAGIGETRSLLRALKTEEAKASVVALLADIDTANSAISALVELSPEALAAQGAVQLPPRPPRPTVALTRIASVFLDAGLTVEARGCLEKAIILSPNGASRARQILARLSLAADDPARAEALAREALQMGRFQAKTVAAWPLYLDARARQGLVPVLEPPLYQALTIHSTGRILATSVLSIVRTLRGHGDSEWKRVAEGFLAAHRASDQIVATEIEKIIHADAKIMLSDEPAVLAARALRLFKGEDVSPSEQVAHAKEHVRYAIAGGLEPKTSLIARLGRERFGSSHDAALRHSMALGAMMANRHDLARDWLVSLAGEVPAGSPPWGRAMWALARMEALLHRDAEASSRYLEVAAHEQTPARFRIQAMLRGFRHLVSSGGRVDVPATSQSVRSILAAADDYKVVLDAGRQLSLAGVSFAPLKLEAAARGAALADAAFAKAGTATEALAILEYLARKQHWDLGADGELLARWDSLPENRRREFRAVGGSTWYDYLSVVYRALCIRGRRAEARLLAASVIEGTDSSPEGYVIVGNEYAGDLMDTGDLTPAFECFEWISRESPSHRRSAAAHYWLALRALRDNDPERMRASAQATIRCFSGAPSTLAEWQLDAKAVCLLAGQDPAEAERLAGSRYSRDFLTRMTAALQSDFGKF